MLNFVIQALFIIVLYSLLSPRLESAQSIGYNVVCVSIPFGKVSTEYIFLSSLRIVNAGIIIFEFIFVEEIVNIKEEIIKYIH